ncbi:hypothetical protein C8F01DRAFT_1339229 [Mycena amicta]|nr:hypothetical protein C8F01DRAFT_1339229 [Mycena amicta]
MLSDEQRCETLMAELNVVRTRMEARKALEASKNNETNEPKLQKAPAKTPEADPPAKESNETPAVVTETPPPAIPLPEHPFAAARDAAYAPPKDRNVGAAPKANIRPPAQISKEGDAMKIFNAALDAQVVISQRDLLSVSPDIRSLYREAVTPRRNAVGTGSTQLMNTIENPLGNLAEYAANDSLTAEYLHAQDAREKAIRDALPASYTVTAGQVVQNPTDGVVLSDPFETFFIQGTIPEGLVVAADSTAIRTILPIVDNQQHIESIVDPGSQICAMSESICHNLALSYDPTIILQMQSANGAISPSLGLARNVPFKIGNITLYIQVHIVRNPAYDILLGRPFDVLTQSVVRNYENNDQTITIRDPNTGKTATVPTIPRGSARGKAQDFQYAIPIPPKL